MLVNPRVVSYNRAVAAAGRASWPYRIACAPAKRINEPMSLGVDNSQ